MVHKHDEGQEPHCHLNGFLKKSLDKIPTFFHDKNTEHIK